jgi:hypothetical protein
VTVSRVAAQLANQTLTLCRIVGPNVPSAVATIVRQVYETQKRYVDGLDIRRMNALQSQVTSVFLETPIASRLTAMCRSEEK